MIIAAAAFALLRYAAIIIASPLLLIPCCCRIFHAIFADAMPLFALYCLAFDFCCWHAAAFAAMIFFAIDALPPRYHAISLPFADFRCHASLFDAAVTLLFHYAMPPLRV